jgi:hypothetical protein
MNIQRYSRKIKDLDFGYIDCVVGKNEKGKWVKIEDVVEMLKTLKRPKGKTKQIKRFYFDTYLYKDDPYHWDFQFKEGPHGDFIRYCDFQFIMDQNVCYINELTCYRGIKVEDVVRYGLGKYLVLKMEEGRIKKMKRVNSAGKFDFVFSPICEKGEEIECDFRSGFRKCKWRNK